MFDSLKYAKILEDAGLPRKQAETHIRILSDVIGEEMATKQDLELSISGLKQEMNTKFASVHKEIQGVRHDMVTLEHSLLIKLGGLMITVITLGITANQLLNG